MSNIRTIIAFALVAACIALAVFAPFVAPFDPFRGGADALLPPGANGHGWAPITWGATFGRTDLWRAGLARGRHFCRAQRSILGIIVGSLAGFSADGLTAC